MGYRFDDLSSKVISVAVKVHRQLGPGFLESVYEQALKIELSERGIPFEAQKAVEVRYADQVVGNHILDLMIADELIVELKAVSRFEDVHYAQVRSYLRATDKRVGLLMNFNAPTLLVKRIVCNFEEGTPTRDVVRVQEQEASGRAEQ